MVYGMYSSVDGLNKLNKRNMLNANKYEYNCGGYALNTFSWYCPYGEISPWGFQQIFLGEKLNKEETLQLCVGHMLNEFDDLRLIEDLNELHNDEYAIAFRIAHGDFHFAKRASNGHWFHKRGGTPMIETIKKEEVFSDSWLGVYDSRLVLFAKKK